MIKMLGKEYLNYTEGGECESFVKQSQPWNPDDYLKMDNISNRELWVNYNRHAFQYLKLTFKNCPGTVEIKSVSIRFFTYPAFRLTNFSKTKVMVNNKIRTTYP